MNLWLAEKATRKVACVINFEGQKFFWQMWTARNNVDKTRCGQKLQGVVASENPSQESIITVSWIMVQTTTLMLTNQSFGTEDSSQSRLIWTFDLVQA